MPDLEGANMKVSREQAAQNRERVAEAASRLFRDKIMIAVDCDVTGMR